MDIPVETLENKQQYVETPKSPPKPMFIRTIPDVASHYIDDLCILNQRLDFIDLNITKTHFFNEGRLSHSQVLKILDDSSKILKLEPNLLKIDKPVIIIGDIHGQYYDMINLLENYDLKKETLIFLGDYVDRGVFSTEVYLYLMLLKTYYPKNIYLLRGNHESKRMTEYFTFKRECLHKYSQTIYEKFTKSFQNLPLAAVINKKLYCSHGGISPKINKIKDINKLNRFVEAEKGSLICDILWSDPHPSYNEVQGGKDFYDNDVRGCSYYYTYTGVTKFLKDNDLSCIVRGHEVQESGHRIYQSYKGTPSVVTIFSAPNYCDAYGNMGAVLKFDGSKMKIKTFSSIDHPYSLPNNLDGINWSISYVGEQLSEFYLEILKSVSILSSAESSSTSSSAAEAILTFEIERTENFVSSMSILRIEREKLGELEDEESQMISTDGMQSPESELHEFDEAKEKDILNEGIPKKINPEGISLDVSPSLIPTIVKEIGELDLDKVLDNGNVDIVEEDNSKTLDLTKSKDKDIKKDVFRCWCFK